jgi:hypothetical protein
MFAILAALCFAIAALIAFATLSGLSVLGMIALGLAFLALHDAFGWPVPWRRPVP